MQAAKVSPVAVAIREADDYVTSYRFEHNTIVTGVEGEIRQGEKLLGKIKFDKAGVLVTDGSFATAAKIKEAQLKKRSGTMAIRWKEDPGDHQLVLNYTHKEYGSGWTMLFIMLGGIYLVSSLCWLFIDCTKTLKDESIGV